jgi:hypothetical protein
MVKHGPRMDVRMEIVSAVKVRAFYLGSSKVKDAKHLILTRIRSQPD